MDTIRVCARPSKGVRVMKVNEGEKLIAAVSVERDEEEPEIQEPETQDIAAEAPAEE